MRINLWEHKKIEDQTEHFAGLEFSNRMSALGLRFQLVIATPVSYTHLRAHETEADLVCRLLLEKKK